MTILPSDLKSDPRQSLPSRSQTARSDSSATKPFALTVPLLPSTLHPISRGFQIVAADANNMLWGAM